MKPSQVLEATNYLVQLKRPGFIWGPPGVGKSDIVAAVAKTRDIQLIDIRMSLMAPTDIQGFPVFDRESNTMRFVPLDQLPRDGEGILFLDEMNSATQATQAAGYQLILNRSIGAYNLPPGWAIIAAGNRAGDRAVVHNMPSALANRFVHLEMEADHIEWDQWAAQNDVSSLTRAFIRFRPGLLHSFNPDTNEKAFPTPRSWVFADQVMGNSAEQKLSPSVRMQLIQGAVGKAAGGEYLAFCDIAASLPSVSEVNMNPETAPLPVEPAAQYAIVTALEKATTVSSFERLMKYITRMSTEFQTLYVRGVVTTQRDITRLDHYTAWVVKNQNVLI